MVHDEGDAVDIDRDDNALNASIGFVLKTQILLVFSGIFITQKEFQKLLNFLVLVLTMPLKALKSVIQI